MIGLDFHNSPLQMRSIFFCEFSDSVANVTMCFYKLPITAANSFLILPLQNLPDNWIRPLYTYKTFPTTGFDLCTPTKPSRRPDSTFVHLQNLPDNWIRPLYTYKTFPTTGFSPLPQAFRLC